MASQNEIKDVRHRLKFRSSTIKLAGEGDNINASAQKTQLSNPRVFTLNDYFWTLAYDNIRVPNADYTVPKLIMHEFQPVRGFRFSQFFKEFFGSNGGMGAQAKGAAGTAANTALSLLENVTGTNALENILGLGKAILAEGYETALIAKYSGQVDDDIAVKFVANFLKGQFLNSYEIPFIGDEYMQADTTSYWSAGGAGNIVGDANAETLQDNFSINFPMTPIWKKTADSNWGVSTTFYLLNDSSESLIKNFNFIHAFSAGAYWAQLEFLQQPPNVYRVICPGRFRKYWCAMGIKVNFKGKSRTNKKVAERLRKDYKGIQENFPFPDAYEMEVTIRDLAPNSFNMIADFLTSTQATKYEENIVGKSITLADQVGLSRDLVNEAGRTLGYSISEKTKQISSGLKAVGNAISSLGS